MLEKSRQFIQEIKEGKIRGEYTSEKVDEGVYLETSVGSFQDGAIAVRFWVEDSEVPRENALYFRRLYKIDQRYREVQKMVQSLINEVNETEVPVAFEPQTQIPELSLKNPELVPKDLDPENTVSFQQSVQIRDDVSLAEALLTNREDGMTRNEIQNLRDD